MNESQEPEKFKIEADQPAPNFAVRARLIRQIRALGYDDTTAARFARLIGDKPTLDADGTLSVMDGNQVLVKLKLSSPSSE